MNAIQAQLREALESLDRHRAEMLFEGALRQQTPMQAIEELIVPALESLGDDWVAGNVALSQIYMSGRICEDMVARALPSSAPARKTQPRHAIVVLSDYHLFGKRIVLSVLRAGGFDILDYGRMEPDELIERVITDDTKILLISTLMLPSALLIRTVREALDARGQQTRIAVGGAPFIFDPMLWRTVGADAMGRSAADALSIISRWMEELA